MIEYIIREAIDPARLVVLVNGSISEGWIPLGGVSITGDSYSITHCQALTREIKDYKVGENFIKIDETLRKGEVLIRKPEFKIQLKKVIGEGK